MATSTTCPSSTGGSPGARAQTVSTVRSTARASTVGRGVKCHRSGARRGRGQQVPVRGRRASRDCLGEPVPGQGDQDAKTGRRRAPA